MNAVDYVKQNGIEKAKIHLEKMKAERWINSFFNDLKQIVDAFELVGDDLEYTKKFYADCAFKTDKHLRELKKAINLVEQCNDQIPT